MVKSGENNYFLMYTSQFVVKSGWKWRKLLKGAQVVWDNGIGPKPWKYDYQYSRYLRIHNNNQIHSTNSFNLVYLLSVQHPAVCVPIRVLLIAGQPNETSINKIVNEKSKNDVHPKWEWTMKTLQPSRCPSISEH